MSEIPEDLKERIRLHKQWLAWHERQKTAPGVEAILREDSVNNIERIAALESKLRDMTQDRDKWKDAAQTRGADLGRCERELDAARAELNDMRKPVMDETVLKMARKCIIPDVYPYELEGFLVQYHEYLASRTQSSAPRSIGKLWKTLQAKENNPQIMGKC